jgi:hypothetical protein
MRRILWAFVILSPIIAIAQRYGWSAASVPVDQMAQFVVTKATVQVADALHALLS